MSNLIDRQAAIDAIQNHFNPQNEEMQPEIAAVLAGVGVVLGHMPSAQPEIIYCRNCRYSKDSGDYQDSYFCYNPHHNQAYLVHSMEFCYHAERKDNG